VQYGNLGFLVQVLTIAVKLFGVGGKTYPRIIPVLMQLKPYSSIGIKYF